MPRMPAHQVTARNLGAAYPFIAEAGLGQRGVVIGDDLLGGSFVFDPFELSAAGLVSNPNMSCLHAPDRATRWPLQPAVERPDWLVVTQA
jgi:hypothetical protein